MTNKHDKKAAREAALIAAARQEVAARAQAPRQGASRPAESAAPPAPVPRPKPHDVPAGGRATLAAAAAPQAGSAPSPIPRTTVDPGQVARRIELLMLAEAEARRKMKRQQQLWLVYVPTAAFVALGLWCAVSIWRVI
ncbi:MAG: hypothetical protein EXR27_15910 [Betaproteobacteria bacterium]|nr:hypothetical protein [Betaproteobacteria bacterium]